MDIYRSRISFERGVWGYLVSQGETECFVTDREGYGLLDIYSDMK